MTVLYDCFMYAAPYKDLLDLRLQYLKPLVDHTVIVESTHTFTGQPQALSFDPSQYDMTRITYVVYNQDPPAKNPWANETAQRNAIMNGLLRFDYMDDIVMIGDIDEIPNRWLLHEVIDDIDRPITCGMDHYKYYANLRVKGESWPGTIVLPGPELKTLSPVGLHNRRWHFDRLHPGGWHFSWLGGLDRIIWKLKNTTHQDLNVPANRDPQRLKEMLHSGRDPLDSSKELEYLDELPLPVMLKERLEEYTLR